MTIELLLDLIEKLIPSVYLCATTTPPLLIQFSMSTTKLIKKGIIDSAKKSKAHAIVSPSSSSIWTVAIVSSLIIISLGQFHILASATMSELELSVSPPSALKAPINVPEKLLMGPGPSNCAKNVLQASSMPVLGHMHKEMFQIMDDIKLGLQYLFQTTNAWTLVVSGPGHLAMEAILVNLVEPGDTLLVACNGLWGNRAIDLANRLGITVERIDAVGGSAFSLDEIEQGLKKFNPKVFFIVHSESSTGVMQPIEGVGDLCEKYGCLLAVDTVASMGGVPFFMDKWKVDAIYTGSQKVIGAPPGIAPISFGPKAVEKIRNRKMPTKSWMLDMNELSIYWGCNGPEVVRTYHHTPPVTLLYALREALASVVTEGLHNLWKRHEETRARLYAGLEAQGLQLFVQNPAHRLPTVTTIRVPTGLDWKHVCQYAMEKYLVEIAGGLGETSGKVFRIGVMGHNAYPEKIDQVLKALREGLEYAKLHGRL